jgi:hypothetical protein
MNTEADDESPSVEAPAPVPPRKKKPKKARTKVVAVSANERIAMINPWKGRMPVHSFFFEYFIL